MRWGESVLDFIAVVQHHAAANQLAAADAVYWVCAYGEPMSVR